MREASCAQSNDLATFDIDRNSATMTSSSAMWFVYVLRCVDNALYVGEAADLESRLTKHNEGSGSAFTAQRRPVQLVFSEVHANRDAALKRERQLKRWTRGKKEALIAGDFELLKRL